MSSVVSVCLPFFFAFFFVFVFFVAAAASLSIRSLSASMSCLCSVRMPIRSGTKPPPLRCFSAL